VSRVLLIAALLIVAFVTAGHCQMEPIVLGPDAANIPINMPAANVGAYNGFFFHPFENIWSWIQQPLISITTQMSGRMITYVRTQMQSFLILSIALVIAGSLMRSMGQDWFGSLMPQLIIAALVMTTFLSAGWYTSTIIGLWQGVPVSLISAITGGPAAANVPAALDVSMVRGCLAATNILENISTGMLNPATWVVAFMVVIEIMFCIVAHVVMFATFAGLSFTGALLVSCAGPVAIAFYAFRNTRAITLSFLACLATTMFATVLLVASLTIIIALEDRLAAEVRSIPLTAGTGWLGDVIIGLGCSAASYIFFGWLAKQSVPLAGAIFGGVTGSINSIVNAPETGGRWLANKMFGGGGGSPAPSGGSSSSSSPSSPPGRSLGRSP
jgi:hypothetical protein